jgi:hypothetical protein
MSRTQLLARLTALHRERRRLLRRLTAAHELAVGTVAVVARKCGNPTCHCADGDGHPQVQFLFKDPDGVRRCKLVRKADHQRLLLAGDRYRDFRADLRRLNDINSQERRILMSLRDLRAIHYE